MELTVFKNEELGQVRTVVKDGAVWFVAKDVCNILELTNTSKALSDLNSKKKGVTSSYTLDTNGGNQAFSILNEQGLYLLLMQSRKPQAIKFQLWVTGDVLPNIRKHGIYATEDFVEQALSNPDHMIKVLQMFKVEKEKRTEAEKTVNILTHVNKTYTATEVAKEIGFKSAVTMNKWLHEQGIQYKQNGTWIMYSKYSALGYDSIKQEVLDNGRVIYHRRITQRGREFIINLYEKVSNKTVKIPIEEV